MIGRKDADGLPRQGEHGTGLLYRLGVAIEPNSRARRIEAPTSLLLFVPRSFFVTIRNIAQGTFSEPSIASCVIVRAKQTHILRESDGVPSYGFLFPCE